MTKPDKSGHLLSVEQANAIDLLVTGTSDRETAEAVGVSRQTVCGWRNHHPAFVAALNSRRLELWGASRDRLRALLPKALDCLEGAVTGPEPDWKAAAKIVELAGLDRHGATEPNLGPVSIGPATPEAVLDAEARKRRPNLYEDMLDGGPVSETERRAVLRELRDLAG